MLFPAQQAFEPRVEWPNQDCDVGPDGHSAEVLPWCRQEKECSCAKEESWEGAGLSPVLITQWGQGHWVLAAAPKAVCMFNDGETVRLSSLLAL